ncbi:MAG TPA: hypothetical protein VGN34_16130 [Ktedonobacteraceae bacterium]
MESRFFSAAQLHQIGTRSRDWLLTLQQRADPAAHGSTNYAFQILLGLWICERGLLNDTELSSTRIYAHNIYQRIPKGNNFAIDLLSSDPALVLFSLGILRFFEIYDSPLERIAAHISTLLQEHSDQNELEANGLFLTRFLLQQLYLHAPLPSYSLQEISARDLLNADEVTIRDVVKNIVAATRYGQTLPTLKMEKTDVLSILASLLPVLTLDYFRLYNLEIGMQILRAMRYLHLYENRGWRTWLQFLVAQQQPDGRFGFFAHELTQLHLSGESEQDFRVYLPYTVSFLWTIAEVVRPQFTLAQSFS